MRSIFILFCFSFISFAIQAQHEKASSLQGQEQQIKTKFEFFKALSSTNGLNIIIQKDDKSENSIATKSDYMKALIRNNQLDIVIKNGMDLGTNGSKNMNLIGSEPSTSELLP